MLRRSYIRLWQVYVENDECIVAGRNKTAREGRHRHWICIRLLFESNPYLVMNGIILPILSDAQFYITIRVTLEVTVCVNLHDILLALRAYTNREFAASADSARHRERHLSVLVCRVEEIEAIRSVELWKFCEEVRVVVFASFLVEIVVIVGIPREFKELINGLTRGIGHTLNCRLDVLERHHLLPRVSLGIFIGKVVEFRWNFWGRINAAYCIIKPFRTASLSEDRRHQRLGRLNIASHCLRDSVATLGVARYGQSERG